jgi:hypothetical protein
MKSASHRMKIVSIHLSEASKTSKLAEPESKMLVVWKGKMRSCYLVDT